MPLTVIILTRNEERHIERCISSVRDIADRIIVVDSGSTDSTRDLARSLGADVFENPWTNHATQFNWALDQLGGDVDWVMRLDADEVVLPDLRSEIADRLSAMPISTNGIYVSRSMYFLERPIRWGGLFPIRVLRLFRHGKGRCEDRWMDEHIIVDGETAEFRGGLIDNNLNSLTWWIDKHNGYASREVVDILNREFQFRPMETVASLSDGQQANVKRWIKENLYNRAPGGLRAFAYFLYRFILRLGILDGREGIAFHILQGFWYRYLVDAKLLEVRNYMRHTSSDAPTAIREVLDIDLSL